MKRYLRQTFLPLLLLLVLLAGCAQKAPPISLEEVPEYTGDPWVELDGNVPSFTEEELETIDSYMAIQKARLPEGFQYETEVPDSLRSAMVPKMLLQPLVENAVIHGVEQDGNGYICIIAAQDGEDLRISVFDDGRGMPPEVVRWINSPSPARPDGHLGLYNLISILKIHYGEGYGLKARSEAGEGTTITIILPMEVKHV